ncbi:MAG: enoyl-CoA hydratase/isomerase family protein [Deltaproteobacteria bacterium]
MSDPILIELRGSALWLTIDRPKERNALSAEAIAGLREGLRRAETDPAVRVVVLTGAGERIFCSGADLSSMVGDGPYASHVGRRAYAELLLALSGCEKPTVARLAGHALAGGLGLALACDFALAAETAELGTPEIDRGLFPMMVMALLQRHVGRKRALWLVTTGQRLPAREALAWGLLSEVLLPAELDPAVERLALTLGKKSQAVLALGRRAFRTAEDLPLAPALEELALALSLNATLEDAAEGVTAFLEKREPHWKDR